VKRLLGRVVDKLHSYWVDLAAADYRFGGVAIGLNNLANVAPTARD
jgi:hypothetical protein